MSLLATTAIQVLVIGTLALVATTLLRSRSAALRHWILAAAVAASLAIPFLALAGPVRTISIPTTWLTPTREAPAVGWLRNGQPATPDAGRSSIPDPQPHGPAVDGSSAWLISIWLGGLLAGLAAVIHGLLRVRSLAARATPLLDGPCRQLVDDVARAHGLRRRVRLLLTSAPVLPMTWGLHTPTIILPARALTWPPDRLTVVVHHELAHIGRRDWLVTLGGQLLRAAHWFNPVAWVLCRVLRREGEQACDDIVLASGVAAADYASHLLEVAREAVHLRPSSPALAIVQPSALEERIRAMLNSHIDRRPLTTRARTGAAALAAALAAPIAFAAEPVIPAAPPARAASALPDRPEADTPPLVTSRSGAQSRSATALGRVEGVLYDQFGGLLPGASVTLVQAGTGARHEVLSNASGAFAIGSLTAGDYELTTSLPGFSTVTNIVTVRAGTALRRQITLPLGTLEEVVSVSCLDNGIASTVAPGAREAFLQGQPTPALFTGGIGGQIRVPRKLVHVRPTCPVGIRRNPALVTLTGRIGIDGLLTDLRAVSGRRWRGRPWTPPVRGNSARRFSTTRRSRRPSPSRSTSAGSADADARARLTRQPPRSAARRIRFDGEGPSWGAQRKFETR
jgi:beta-lactamase regulating signal transducer with metallopeptidase domain